VTVESKTCCSKWQYFHCTWLGVSHDPSSSDCEHQTAYSLCHLYVPPI